MMMAEPSWSENTTTSLLKGLVPLVSGGLYTLNRCDISKVEELSLLCEPAPLAGAGVSGVSVLGEESIGATRV
jgi:hypothetical protein